MSQPLLAGLVWLSTFLIGGCATPMGPEVLLLEVGPQTADCVGEMVQSCLLVRNAPEDEWTNFYDPIEGFEHEEGFLYVIEVERTHVPDPPADGSSYEYRLLRIISKEQI